MLKKFSTRFDDKHIRSGGSRAKARDPLLQEFFLGRIPYGVGHHCPFCCLVVNFGSIHVITAEPGVVSLLVHPEVAGKYRHHNHGSGDSPVVPLRLCLSSKLPPVQHYANTAEQEEAGNAATHAYRAPDSILKHVGKLQCFKSRGMPSLNVPIDSHNL